jgi:hypothetical protein
MNELNFEFECEDDKIKLSHDDGEVIWYEVTDSAGRKFNRKWEFTITPSACIRALLARDTEREAIFAEAMRIADEMAGTFTPNITSDYRQQLKSFAARWQATSGDATGAEGQG